MQLACHWHAFFVCLETLHCLNHHDPSHLWLLHRLFLNLINEDCLDFKEMWSQHPLSSIGTDDMSPAVSVLASSGLVEKLSHFQELCFFGTTAYGKPIDEFTGSHPDILNLYCSTHGPETQCEPNITGAGHPPEEMVTKQLDKSSGDKSNLGSQNGDDSEREEYAHVQAQLTADLQGNITHKAVKVPYHHNPFATHPEVKAMFLTAFTDTSAEEAVPEHFGVLAEEWEMDTYPTHEDLKCGCKGRSLDIALPEDIWLPRAVAWARALYIMKGLVYSMESGDSH
jgi:hypothetical protein